MAYIVHPPSIHRSKEIYCKKCGEKIETVEAYVTAGGTRGKHHRYHLHHLLYANGEPMVKEVS